MNERPSSPGIIYGVLTLVLVVLIAGLALTQRQPSPPTIAEFAPQAVENITETPEELSSRSARSGGALAGAPPTPTPLLESQTSAGVDVPRVRRCVGDPPRQIEDPQSPPCVPYWSGDNGGATYRGVTRDEIRIALPRNNNATRIALQSFFNKRFEFYGRKLNIVPGGGGGGNCTDRRAGALGTAQQLRAFAALDSAGPSTMCYYDELARLGVIGVTWEPHYSEAEMAPNAPYEWMYMMGYDKMFANLGRWTCRRLAGRAARYAGDPLMQTQKRKFGVLVEYDQRNSPVSTAALKRELSSCGARIAVERHITEDREGNGQKGVSDPTLTTNAVLAMKSEGVTTVFCLCLLFIQQYVPPAATAQSYFPEWILSSFFLNDDNLVVLGFWPDAEQRKTIMGLTFQPRQRKPEVEPAYWAAKDSNPSASARDFGDALSIYRSLLLLASGIQMAGPNLTPTTFEKGLQRTRFPNPQNDIGSGKVGFSDGDHSMTDDAAEMWWFEGAVSPNATSQTGAYCYVDGGARRDIDGYPAGDDPFFKPPCFSGA